MTAAAAPLLNEFAAIRDFLKAAQDQLKEGYLPDIRAIEKRIETLCGQVHAAEDAVQKECLPQLANILEALDGCERQMRIWHDANLTPEAS